MTSPSPRTENRRQLRVDRVACTGHGVCASLLPRSVSLDEWGYPVVAEEGARGRRDSDEAQAAAIRWCPAMALYRLDAD